MGFHCSTRKMKLLRLTLILATAVFGGCDRFSDSDAHEQAILEFQDGQERFKRLISTVRDEESFDRVKPELEQVVADWRRVAADLKVLNPPSDAEQDNFSKVIEEGHRKTEPTGADMLGLVTIETRESEVTAWLESFATAGRAVGNEMLRLYGPTGYAKEPRVNLRDGKITIQDGDSVGRHPTDGGNNTDPVPEN